MSTITESMIDNEREITRARLHWQVLAGPWIILVVGLIGAAVISVKSSNTIGPEARLGWLAAGCLTIASGLPLLLQWSILRSTEYVLTSRRLIVARGLLARTTIEVLLTRITGVDVEQSLFGRMGNFGTVTVIGFAGAQDVFQNIVDPHGFRKCIEQQLGSGRVR